MWYTLLADKFKRKTMQNSEGLSSEELKELILEQLDEVGVAPGTVEVKVLKGPKLVLEGKVDSDRKRKLIVQIVRYATGIDDIIDEMIVVEDECADYREETGHEEYELYDEDNEYVGSEDVFQAVVDGVPYVPPTEPPFSETAETLEEEKKRRKKKGKKT
jgi:hypothetical protein